MLKHLKVRCCVHVYARFIVPKKLTYPPVLTEQCGEISGMVDR